MFRLLGRMKEKWDCTNVKMGENKLQLVQVVHVGKSVFPNAGSKHFSALLQGMQALVVSVTHRSTTQKNRLSNMVFW